MMSDRNAVNIPDLPRLIGDVHFALARLGNVAVEPPAEVDPPAEVELPAETTGACDVRIIV